MNSLQFYNKTDIENHLTAEELFEQGEAYKVQNPEKAFQSYLKAADMGYPKAMNKVGHCYLYKGQGVDFDIYKASYWHRKAAENGYANAMAMTAWYYMAGITVPQDDEIAQQWMKKAIDMGDENTVMRVKKELNNYEKTKSTVTALFDVATEMGGIPRK